MRQNSFVDGTSYQPIVMVRLDRAICFRAMWLDRSPGRGLTHGHKTAAFDAPQASKGNHGGRGEHGRTRRRKPSRSTRCLIERPREAPKCFLLRVLRCLPSSSAMQPCLLCQDTGPDPRDRARPNQRHRRRSVAEFEMCDFSWVEPADDGRCDRVECRNRPGMAPMKQKGMITYWPPMPIGRCIRRLVYSVYHEYSGGRSPNSAESCHFPSTAVPPGGPLANSVGFWVSHAQSWRAGGCETKTIPGFRSSLGI
jgi:hypothetical protein